MKSSRYKFTPDLGTLQAEGQPIYLIGVEFSKEARNLVAFEVQGVDQVDANAINSLTNS